MRNGWTGGQYRFYRAIFGGYLFIHYCGLVSWGPELFSRRGVLPDARNSPLALLFPNILSIWDSSLFVQVLLVLAAGLSIALAIGFWDRTAATMLWYLATCLFDRNPLIANPALPYIGWLLLAHAFLPAAPGEWLCARGKGTDSGRWRVQPQLYAIAWILMALGYSYSGLSKLGSPSWLDGSAVARILASPLARPGVLNKFLLSLAPPYLRCATWCALAMEIGFAPLSLFHRARPWVWAGMFSLHLSLLLLVAFPDLTAGMLMIHLFTFDPSWIPGVQAAATENIFYDGQCGLCHWAVRLAIAEDITASRFRYAPLRGKAFERLVPEAVRSGLPDSVVLLTSDGRFLTRSTAVIRILERLGGVWRCLGVVLALVPSSVGDLAYDFIARNRLRLLRLQASSCPIVPSVLGIPDQP
jgi:predicted DCC family thiol-disulfide oxidoreductase YuxK